jgi:hypothetical protein
VKTKFFVILKGTECVQNVISSSQFWKKDWFLYENSVFLICAPHTGTVCKAAFPGPTNLITDHSVFHITECVVFCFVASGQNVAGLVLVNTLFKQNMWHTFNKIWAHHIFFLAGDDTEFEVLALLECYIALVQEEQRPLLHHGRNLKSDTEFFNLNLK